MWLEIAERQDLDLPDDNRALVDERLAQREYGSLGSPDAIYDAASDQWRAPVAARGLILYAVVAELSTVIVLRLVVL